MNDRKFHIDRLLPFETDRSRFLLWMYCSPKHQRLVRREDAEKIYNFHQRTSDVEGISFLFGGSAYFAYCLWSARRRKSRDFPYGFDEFRGDLAGIVFTGFGIAISTGIYMNFKYGHIITSALKPYDMNNPERAEAYKMVYRDLSRWNRSYYDAYVKGEPLPNLNQPDTNSKPVTQPTPQSTPNETPTESLGQRAVRGERAYSSLTRDQPTEGRQETNRWSSYDEKTQPSFGNDAPNHTPQQPAEVKFEEKIEFK